MLAPLAAMQAGLVHPCGPPPGPGEIKPVAEGIYWLRMAVPGPLNHINLWLLEGSEGWTIVDTGMKLPETIANWETILGKHLGGKTVRRVVVTHMHPDHAGLAGWLCERYEAPLYMSLGEYLMAVVSSNRLGGEDPGWRLRHYASHGMPEEALAGTGGRPSGYSSQMHPLPPNFIRLMHGERVKLGGLSFQVMVAYGHSPEHVSLWCAKRGVLIAGDQVLPKISTNVSVWPTMPMANALQLFLDGMRQFRELPEDSLVLPAHGEPFLGLQHRLAQLEAHHDERLGALQQALAAEAERGMDAWELMGVLFPAHRKSSQLMYAFSETLAHVHCLEARARVRRQTDAGGRIRFIANAAAELGAVDDGGPMEVEGA